MPDVGRGRKPKVFEKENARGGPISDYCYCAMSLGIPWIVQSLLSCDTRAAEQRICTLDTETPMVLPVCIGIYMPTPF